jgi:hypothetical protein
MNQTDLPDEMMVSGTRADGVNVSSPVSIIRNPKMNPRLKGIKLFVALPVYQKLDVQFMQCLLALQKERPCELEVSFCQGDGIARTRNRLTQAFLKSDCTHILFIDCDLIFSPAQIEKLLLHDLPIIGGFYPKKQEGSLEWVVNTMPDLPHARPDGLQQVRFAGTGFLCIARTVFEQMQTKFPQIAFREDYGDREIAHDYWSMGVYRTKPEDEGRYLSEDWFFCQRWLDIGGEIFCDTHVILRHIGIVIFPLQSQMSALTPDHS